MNIDNFFKDKNNVMISILVLLVIIDGISLINTLKKKSELNNVIENVDICNESKKMVRFYNYGLNRYNATNVKEWSDGGRISYGDNYRLSKKEFDEIWFSEKRSIPYALAHIKAQGESSFRPFVALYEKWADNNNNEFANTSYGLFQILGMNLKSLGYMPRDTNNVFADYGVREQMDSFDKLMGMYYNADEIKSKDSDFRVFYAIAKYGKPATSYYTIKHIYERYKNGYKGSGGIDFDTLLIKAFDYYVKNKEQLENSVKEYSSQKEDNLKLLSYLLKIGFSIAFISFVLNKQFKI